MMRPQIAKRTIGKVTILDIRGSFTRPLALRSKQELPRQFQSQEVVKILNLRPITNLDTLGARVILESVPNAQDISMLAGNPHVMDLMNRFSEGKQFRLFWNEREIASSFGKDLVSAPIQIKERRAHPRLSMALPLEFYDIEEKEPIRFRAIITNLSSGGLFAEYIDLKHAEESLEHVDPYDLHPLHLAISFPRGKVVEGEGKVVHRRLDGDQLGVGIEFYRLDQKEQQAIVNFLANNQASYEL